jgi:peptidoglycan/xylan/chitin deacetylase (PgdA/CDA1 family)
VSGSDSQAPHELDARTLLTSRRRFFSLLGGCATTLGFGFPQQLASAQTASLRAVALTFDDLPSTSGGYPAMRRVTELLTTKLKRSGAPAIGFVNESKLFVRGEIDRRSELLAMWLNAGLSLGNHSFSHVQIDRVTPAQYRDEIVRGEAVTRMLLRERGRALTYYRHTQLRTGPTADYQVELATILNDLGYIVAPVTFDNDEYIFARVYEDAKSSGEAAAAQRIVDAYLAYMEQTFGFYERLSVDTLGYEVRQTLLLHANELNADHLEPLLGILQRRGYRFISLEEALEDPAYKLPQAQSRRGISWLQRWRLARRLPTPDGPGVPTFIAELMRSSEQRRRARPAATH